MIDSKAGMGSLSVTVTLSVHDRLQDRYGYMISSRAGTISIGSWIDLGSVSVLGPA